MAKNPVLDVSFIIERAVILNNHRIWFACLFLFNSAVFAEDPIVIGSYAYNDYDRASVFAPLKETLESLSPHDVAIKIYESPTMLIQGFEDGEVQILVPNLIGF